MRETQKHLKMTGIAGAVLALSLQAAQAQESPVVRIGGKYDAGYQFKHTASLDDSLGHSAGGVTTETLGDGGASTSRITVGVTEKLGYGMEAYIDLDLRYGTIEESGGLTSNDKKVMGLRTPIGTLVWGVYNITNLVEAEKAYMVSPKDMEIVKFGVSNPRQSDLTNRDTEFYTPLIPLGQSAGMLFKGDYAFGDAHKSGDSDIDGKGCGDAGSVGYEFVYGRGKALRDFTLNYVIVRRGRSSNAAPDSHMNRIAHITYRPWFDPNLKFSAGYNVTKGYNPNITLADGGPAFKEKNTNFVLSYNIGAKIEFGLEISHNNDLGSNRNSGKGFMVGGAYFLSKSVYIYTALSKADYARNESYAGGKYDGTKAGFKDTLKKVDEHYLRFGMVKEF